MLFNKFFRMFLIALALCAIVIGSTASVNWYLKNNTSAKKEQEYLNRGLQNFINNQSRIEYLAKEQYAKNISISLCLGDPGGDEPVLKIMQKLRLDCVFRNGGVANTKLNNFFEFRYRNGFFNPYSIGYLYYPKSTNQKPDPEDYNILKQIDEEWYIYLVY